MKIEFLGGARSVTGSCYIVKDDDFTMMIDCGMFQGKRKLRERNALSRVFDPGKIDFLLLTHAHIDHSGLIPKLIKNGFKGKIYATRATADLATIMLPDSAHIQEMDVKWVNKKNRKLGRPEIDPLYTKEDAEEAIKQFLPTSYGEIVEIHPKIKIRFRDAGHILGSSIIEVWIKSKNGERKIVFSGDLGQKDQTIIRDPEIIDEADILFIESTYGDRLHKNKKDTYAEFKKIILDSYNEKGNIIIPAFAIERTQEIIYTLSQLFDSGEIPRIPVYVDSPLAISATEIFRRNEQCFDAEAKEILLTGESPLDFKNLFFTRSAKESKKLNKEAKGAIIISASGMCTAGRIKFHLQNNLYKKRSSIVFVGYQAAGTLGRRIIEGAKQVRLYGEDVAVHAKVFTLGGFSAHADRDGLLDWMSNIKNKKLKVFVVHGEEDVSQLFTDTIKKELSFDSYLPQWGEIIDLDTMESEFVSYDGKGEFLETDGEIKSLSESLERMISMYNDAKKSGNLYDKEELKQDISDAQEMIKYIINEF